MSNVTTAVEMFQNGYACSQAVFVAYADSVGVSRDTAMKIASGFGGGMRQGDTCGAVTGAIMVLGMRHAGDGCDTTGGRADVYARVVDFSTRFRERNGSLMCRDLLSADISTPEGRKQANDRDAFKTVCPRLVESAAAILEEMEATAT